MESVNIRRIGCAQTNAAEKLAELRRQKEPVVVVDFNPTAENIARMIFDYALGQGLPVVEVTLWETENSFATYRPG